MSYLTIIVPCIAGIFSKYNHQDAALHNSVYFCKTLYMFQAVSLLPIIKGTELYIQLQVFVEP